MAQLKYGWFVFTLYKQLQQLAINFFPWFFYIVIGHWNIVYLNLDFIVLTWLQEDLMIFFTKFPQTKTKSRLFCLNYFPWLINKNNCAIQALSGTRLKSKVSRFATQQTKNCKFCKCRPYSSKFRGNLSIEKLFIHQTGL